MNKLLNNIEWLRDAYVDKKYSLQKICNITKTKHPHTIKRILNRHGVILRGLRDSHMVGKDEFFIIDSEIINGTLLGDACLHKQSKTEETAPRYSKYSSKEDYAIHVASALSKSPSERIFYTSKDSWGKISEGYMFQTYTSELLSPIYAKWYPPSNVYKKIVPKDIILTPRTILYWFMDDGWSSYVKNKRAKNGRTFIVGGFCTESFTRTENEFLCVHLKAIGVNARVEKNNGGTGFRIKLNQSSFPSFFNLIGPCPVKSMDYKWKHV